LNAASRTKVPIEREWWWQLRVELLEIAPVIWRRIIVPESITLPRLHRVLQASLGWTNSHLHEFIINGVRYSEPDPDGSEELHQVDERRMILHRPDGGMRCRNSDRRLALMAHSEK
jgi:Plasmid pRiA4b ORF-3-like protein